MGQEFVGANAALWPEKARDCTPPCPGAWHAQQGALILMPVHWHTGRQHQRCARAPLPSSVFMHAWASVETASTVQSLPRLQSRAQRTVRCPQSTYHVSVARDSRPMLAPQPIAQRPRARGSPRDTDSAPSPPCDFALGGALADVSRHASPTGPSWSRVSPRVSQSRSREGFGHPGWQPTDRVTPRPGQLPPWTREQCESRT